MQYLAQLEAGKWIAMPGLGYFVTSNRDEARSYENAAAAEKDIDMYRADSDENGLDLRWAQAEPDEPEFDSHGYPTDATLDAIHFWPTDRPSDHGEVLAFVKRAWNADYGRYDVYGNRHELVTGGWSGNEDIVSAMQDNFLFWSSCWRSSKRGGQHEFEIPLRMEL